MKYRMSPVFPEPQQCFEAAKLLVAGDKSTAPIMFTEKAGYSLPHRVMYGSCAIFMTIAKGEDVAVTTTFYEIQNIVRIIMEQCVNSNADTRGGMFTFGKLYVALNGRDMGARGETNRMAESESYAYEAEEGGLNVGALVSI